MPAGPQASPPATARAPTPLRPSPSGEHRADQSDGGPLGGRRAKIAAAETPSSDSLMSLAVGVVVVAGLYFAREVLIPITLAVLLSFVLGPLVNGLRRLHLGKALSTILAVVLSLGIILGVGGALGTQVAELAQDLPRYQTTIHHKIDDVRGVTLGRLNDLVRGLGHELQAASNTGAAVTGAAATSAPADQKPIPVEVREPSASPIELAERFLTPIVSPLATMGIIFIVAIFILIQKEDLRDRLIRLFGSNDLHRTTAAMDDAARRLSKYFLTQLALNASFGAVIGVGLFFIGVPSPLLWGILAGLLRFVPYVGPVLGAVAPLALAAAVDPGWSMLIWTAALFVVVESICGQAIEPLIYGHSTGLSPVAVIVAAIFWTWLWGSIGLILSTPLTLCLVVLGRHVDRLEFIDVLLGDRPALTPVESYYQRMLAGDPDEVEDYAELLLKERSLSSYYDEVAIRGLQLAAADAARGVLTDVQVKRIREAVEQLVRDLDGYDDADPAPAQADDGAAGAPAAERALPRHSPASTPVPAAPERGGLWASPEPVLCVAGRGALDEAAAMMLAQLLRKHGIGARVAAAETVARANIGTLDIGGVALVAVCALELVGSPSHLRYLLRRLRQRNPGVRLMAGLWASNEVALSDKVARDMLGVDLAVGSLRDAVAVCVAEASASAGPAGAVDRQHAAA